MKLISLNTWSGKIFDPLIRFVKTHSQDTDIFCFQEVYNTKSNVRQYRNIRANLLEEFKKILTDFNYFYTNEISGFDSEPNPVDFDLTVGKAIFIKKDLEIKNQGELEIFGDKSEKNLKKDFSNLAISLQYIEFTSLGKQFIICNFHGISFPGSKLDTNLRLKQSGDILAFLERKKSAKIIAGDFNLLPHTESIKILEGEFKNLIKQFHIKRTRSNLSPYAGQPDFQKFADYVFVSTEVDVNNFQVPVVEIADHLPMILEFN